MPIRAVEWGGQRAFCPASTSAAPAHASTALRQACGWGLVLKWWLCTSTLFPSNQ